MLQIMKRDTTSCFASFCPNDRQLVPGKGHRCMMLKPDKFTAYFRFSEARDIKANCKIRFARLCT